MISRKVKIQFAAFLVIAPLGVGYVGGQYAGLDRLFGPRGYVVDMEMPDSGGIFANAEVTYRGVTVGRVGQLELTDTGVDVPLDIDPSAPPIPANTSAVVANRSAVGEQYVDLRPQTAQGPYLANGSTIPADRTSTPLPPQDLLMGLDTMVSSVPRQSLTTVINELGTAFQGTNGKLGTLLDASNSLTRSADEHLPQTTDLVLDGRTVLATQQAEAADITSFGRDLHAFAGQLRTSDPDFRRLINAAPGSADEIGSLLRESGPGLGVVLANLLTTSEVVQTRLPGVEQTLVDYPMIIGGANTTVPGDGRVHLGLVFNSFDPMMCTHGYEGTRERPADDTSDAPANPNARCAEPPGSPIDVRGAQNAPSGGPIPTPAHPQPVAPR